MKIKLEWNFNSDEWDVRDKHDDILTHSSRYDGEYISVNDKELSELRRFKEAFIGYAKEKVPSYQVLIYESLCEMAGVEPYE